MGIAKINYDSPKEVRRLLQNEGLVCHKRFGQNFLLSPEKRKNLVNALCISPDETIWEIGAGLGSLTEELLPLPIKLIVFEIDEGFNKLLMSFFGSASNFRLIQGDFREKWKDEGDKHGKPNGIIGNLPYAVSSSIISLIIEEELLPSKMVLTVQREVGERIIARPGNRNYSSFSVLCQSCYRITKLFIIKPGSFFPKPDVDSCALHFSLKDYYEHPTRIKFFSRLVRAFFSSRRKTLQNNINNIPFLSHSERERLKNIFRENHIPLSKRPEELSANEYVNVITFFQ